MVACCVSEEHEKDTNNFGMEVQQEEEEE